MSSTVAAAFRPIALPRFESLRGDPAAQAFLLLRIGLTVLPHRRGARHGDCARRTGYCAPVADAA